MKFRIKLRIPELIYLVYSVLVLSLMLLNVITDYRVSMYLLAITFVWIVILTLKYKDLSLYQMFLFTYFFFLLSRVFLTIIGQYDFRDYDYLQSGHMSNELAIRTLNVLTVFLVGTSYAWLMRRGEKDWEGRYFKQKVDALYFDYAYKIIFFIFFIMSIMQYIYVIQYVRAHGYSSLFLGANIKYPVILTYAAQLFECFFLLLTYFHRERKSMKLYFSFFLFAAIVRMFEGQRGFTFVLILYIVYLWSTYYSEIKFYNLRILLLILLIPFVVYFITNFRSGNTGRELINIFQDDINMYVRLLGEQGVSLTVVSNTIRLGDKFTNKVPFILGYFTDFFLRGTSGQTMEAITRGNYLGNHLTYQLNPTAFLNGGGTGTSIVAEVYDTFNGSLLFLLLAAFFITLFVFYIEKRAYKNIYLYVISFTLLRQFIYSPRDSVFKFLGRVLAEILVCALIMAVENTMKNRKRNKEIV